MGFYHLIASVLFLFLVIREGLTLQCIQCNSASKTDCDANPSAHARECVGNATACRKMEQEIYYEDDYHVRTIRQCAYELGPMKCIERTGTYRFKVYYCHCEGDNCNGVDAASMSLIVLSISTLVGYLFKL